MIYLVNNGPGQRKLIGELQWKLTFISENSERNIYITIQLCTCAINKYFSLVLTKVKPTKVETLVNLE